MDYDYATIHSVWTVLMVITFIGILVWAWSGKRRKTFDEAAQMPLEDDIPAREDRAHKGTR